MQFEQALGTLSLLYKNAPNDENYLLSTAACYESLGQSKKAAAFYEQLITQNDSHNIAKNRLAQLYKKRGLYKEALVLYIQLIASDRSNAYYHKQRAYLALQLGDIQQGLFSYQDALTYNSNDLDALFGLAKIYLEIRYYEAVDSLIEIGLEQDFEHMPLRTLALNSAYRQNDFSRLKEQALENFKISNDSSAYPLKLLAIAHYHLGAYAESIKCFDRLKIKEEQTEVVCNYLGLAHFELGQFRESEKYFAQALELGISAKTGNYHRYLGLNQHQLGDYKGSIDSFEKAYEFESDPLLFYYIGRSYDELYADKEPAKKFYLKFLEEKEAGESPYSTYVEERLTQFKKIEHFKNE